jgi:glucokinase
VNDLVACVDVGGTMVKSGVLDRQGTLHDRSDLPSPQGRSVDADEVVELVCDTVAGLRDRHRVVAAGVVVPGIVDERRGVAVWSANLGWRDVEAGARLATRVGVPLALGHDVRAGALAESRFGASRGHRNSVFLAVGTGIAAGIMVDGRMVSADGWAGEVGHADVGHGERCACDNTGCLEAVASATAIARRYAVRSGSGPVTAAEVGARARTGDQTAVAVWGEAVSALATAIAWLAHLVAPEVVVVGGGLSAAGAPLLEPLRRETAGRLSFQRGPEIVATALGDQAGCVGAGLLAWNTVEARA